MTYDEAERLVTLWIDGVSAIDAVIVPDLTLDKPYGWVFFWQSRAYLATGNKLLMLGGNSPVVANRFTGELVPMGTALPTEEYLSAYEATLPPAQLEAKPQLRVRPSHAMDLRSFKRAVRDWTDLEDAAFHLARGIGLLDARASIPQTKHVFWSNHPVGDAVYAFMKALVAASVLLERDEPDLQVRWNDAYRGTWEAPA